MILKTEDFPRIETYKKNRDFSRDLNSVPPEAKDLTMHLSRDSRISSIINQYESLISFCISKAIIILFNSFFFFCLPPPHPPMFPFFPQLNLVSHNSPLLAICQFNFISYFSPFVFPLTKNAIFPHSGHFLMAFSPPPPTLCQTIICTHLFTKSSYQLENCSPPPPPLFHFLSSFVNYRNN